MTRAGSTFGVWLLAVALTAGCGESGPVSDNSGNVGSLPEIESRPPDEITGAGDVEPGNATGPEDTSGTAPQIPAPLHGRWALAPADCTSTRGDATGLMIVTADELRFYESVAKPTSDAQSAAESISGNFNFIGEGMKWTRYETLQLQKGQLIRTQSDPTRSFTYIRCSA